MKKTIFLALLIATVWCCNAARAAETMHMSGSGNMSAASQEYMKAMDNMHGDMMSGIMDPDPDTAFVRGMLPHHEGAVEMAKIELKYGKDPELRKLAQAIIDAQEKEIEFMRSWLEKNGKIVNP